MKGKTVVVTGAAGGVGSALVRRFLAEGMNVVGSVRREGEKLEQGAISVQADVTNEQEVKKLFDAVEKQFGSPDFVVNTVGGFLPSKRFSDVTEEEWMSMMKINLTTAFLCTREAVRRMTKTKPGSIVNFSAMVGLEPTAGKTPYAVSKAAVSVLTEAVARELRGTKISINAIAPGIVATEANKESMPDADAGKWVTLESIGDLVVWLCSEKSAAVSGTTFKAYGGL